MKRKFIIALIGIMTFASGCGGSTKEPVKNVSEESQVTEKEGTEGIEVEVLGDDVVPTSNDASDLYYESDNLLSLPMGTLINGEPTIVCNVKVPSNYTAEGMGYKNGEEVDVINESVKSSYENGDLSDAVTDYVILIDNNGGNHTFNYEVYSSDEVTLDSEKEYTSDGVDFGSESMPGYAYIDPEMSDSDLTQFCASIQLNENSMIMMRYGGPLIEELGIKGLADKLFEQVELVE